MVGYDDWCQKVMTPDKSVEVNAVDKRWMIKVRRISLFNSDDVCGWCGIRGALFSLCRIQYFVPSFWSA